MRIWHEFCRCIHCGEELEIEDRDVYFGFIKCFNCGYINDLEDPRLDSWENEY